MMDFLLYAFGFSFSAIFLFQEAKNFQEYTDNLYITTSSAVGFAYFVIIVFKMEKLFTMMKNVEKNIKKSEWIS